LIRKPLLRMLAILIAVPFIAGIAACSASDGSNAGQGSREQSGPYIGGAGGTTR
jgi:hypothetical protein